MNRAIKPWFIFAVAVFAVGLLTLAVAVRCYVISDAEYSALSLINALPVGAVTASMLTSGLISGLMLSIGGCVAVAVTVLYGFRRV